MTLAELQSAFDAELGAVQNADELARLKSRSLAQLGDARKNVDFTKLSADEKRAFGGGWNALKKHIEDKAKEAADRFAASRATVQDFDLTLPGTGHNAGAIHPILSTQLEVEDIFRSMGFQVFLGDEAVSEFDNFDAVNIPPDHPARDMQDTFWLENGMLLRTHTSSMQNRAMREIGTPLRAIFPGRCFRNEATDMTHENTFYQLEGMMIDRGITVANLIAVMTELLKNVFRREIEVRLRPGFFPFVEPGFELDMKTVLKGQTRWMELMPCGMIHPQVLKLGGVDPNEWSGFAFGLGLTRLAMLKYGIQDVRLFNKGDLRFYEQFRATL
jgi:phenylalanyl-tRNA synthetase alpha chain